MATILRCTEAFSYTEPNGVQRVLRPGDLVTDDDYAVGLCPDRFEPAEANAEASTARALEQATSAPGETRATRKPRKATASK